MELLKLFTREEPVAGLEISPNYLRLVLLVKKKVKEKIALPPEETPSKVNKKNAAPRIPKTKIVTREETRVKTSAEEPLAEGVIVDGRLVDTEGFKKSLNTLLKRAKVSTRYVVVSLPSDALYSHLYSFPKTVTGEKLEESMKLTVGFQLPMAPTAAYLDWEKVPEKQENFIFLAALDKGVADEYLHVLAENRLKVVAVECHPMSVARSLRLEPDQPALVWILSRGGATAVLVKNKIIKFVRFIPAAMVNNSVLKEETRKLKNYYAVKYGEEVALVVPVGEGSQGITKPSGRGGTPGVKTGKANSTTVTANQPASKTEKGFDSTWLTALGAALRGVLARRDDTLVSLMPVGTEEAYERQKAVAFAEFISSLSIGISIFFAAVFVGVWVLMISLQESVTARLSSLSALPVPRGAADLEKRATEFNELTGMAAGLVRKIPRPSEILEEIKGRALAGIDITTFSLPQLEGDLTLAGVASDRPTLNAFKKNMEDSAMFTDVSVPLTNVGQRNSIPFTVSFRLRDPSTLYYQ